MLSRKHTAHANNCSVCVVGHDVVGLCFLLKLPCVLFSSCSPLSLFVAQEPDSNRKGSKMRRVLQWGLPIHVPFVRQSSSERTNERMNQSSHLRMHLLPCTSSQQRKRQDLKNSTIVS